MGGGGGGGWGGTGGGAGGGGGGGGFIGSSHLVSLLVLFSFHFSFPRSFSRRRTVRVCVSARLPSKRTRVYFHLASDCLVRTGQAFLYIHVVVCCSTISFRFDAQLKSLGKYEDRCPKTQSYFPADSEHILILRAFLKILLALESKQTPGSNSILLF